MPLHVYHCASCQRDHELLIHSSQSEAVSCPDCAGTDMQRQLSTFAVGHSTGPANHAAEASACPVMGGCPGGACPMMN